MQARFFNALANIKKQNEQNRIQEEQKKFSNAIISLTNYTIPYNELTFEPQSLIAHGGFAEVHKATWNKEPVAVKKLKDFNWFVKRKEDTNQVLKIVKNEIDVLQKITNNATSYIVKYYGASLQPISATNAMPNIYIVLEHLPMGDLCDFIAKYNEALTWDVRYKFMLGLAKSVEYLHQINYIHVDLKLENLLLDENYNIKLCDLAFAEHADNTTNVGRGTPEYIAPEVYQEKNHSFSSDVFSMGICFFEIGAGRNYYTRPEKISEEDYRKLIERFVVLGKKAVIPDNFPKKISALIEKCLTQDPKQRPTANNVVKELESISENDLCDTNLDSLKKCMI